MLTADSCAPITERIQQTSSFLILLPSQPTFDMVAAALSLHLALQSAKKYVDVACPDPMRVEFGNLVAVNQVKTSVGNQSLQITFDYSDESVENVTYDLDKENGKFHLLVRPQKGQRSLDPSTVSFTHVGLDVETIFMMGVQQFDQIEPFYSEEQKSFTEAHLVSFVKSAQSVAQTTFDVTGHSSYAEMTALFLQYAGLEMSSDIATNLLSGIEMSTENYRHLSVTPDTFEICAQLLRQGARRHRQSPQVQPTPIPMVTPTTTSTSSFAQALNQRLNAPPTSNGVHKDIPVSTLQYQPPVR